MKKERIIKRRTHLILFGLLPLILWILGTYMMITANIGSYGLIFYLPLWIDLIASWFFKTEKHTSIFDRIPERVKLISFVVMLIFILGVAPMIGIFSIVDFSKIPFSFALREDTTQLLLGVLLIGCSCIFWVITFYALDSFRSIRSYISRYYLSAIGVLLFLALFYKWFETADIFYLVVGFLAMLLCVGVTTRRCFAYIW